MSGINPLQLWKETGLQSYDYCSRAQTFAFSYAYLNDALKTQSPACVVLDAYSVLSDKSCNGLIDLDFHFGVNMDNLSADSKAELLKEYVPAGERLLYLFPLLKNHNYYRTWEDTEDETDRIYMGFCFADTVQSYGTPVYSDAVSPMDDTDRFYLEQIIGLCLQKGIDLFVIKTPVAYSDEHHSVLNDVKQVCAQSGIDFYDMSEDCIQWGFDYSQDMMDESHVNQYGAAKVTAHLADILADRLPASADHTRPYESVWQEEFLRMTETEEDT